MTSSIFIRNAAIHTGRAGVVRAGHDLLAEGGRIVRIAPTGEVIPPPSARVIAADGRALLPGFIDIHVHGAMGADFMDATPEALETIGKAHAAGGTTAYLATTASHSTARIHQAIANVRAAMDANAKPGGVRILGMHLEGPYFAKSKKGCHLPGEMRNPSPEEWVQFIAEPGVVRHTTLAPELPGALEYIRRLAQAKITPSAGHSDATYDQVMRAVEAGLRHVTHLFSAMSTITKDGPYRHGGLLEAALLEDALTTELIADGHHVPPELARLAMKCKAPAKMAFCTDAMRGLGMPDGRYTFGGREGTVAIVERGVAVDLERTGFASSTSRMIDLLRVAVTKFGVSLSEAAERMALTPARIVSVADRKGSLDVGKDCDAVLVTDDCRVAVTVCEGEVTYEACG